MTNTINDQSEDFVLGTRTWGDRMVVVDMSPLKLECLEGSRRLIVVNNFL